MTDLDAPTLGTAYAPPGAIYSPGSNVGASVLPPPEPPKPRPGPAADALKPDAAPVPVGGDVQSAKLIKKVTPSYPDPARRLRISGTVHLVGIIGKDGSIQNLQVISGNPFLTQAALDAVRQWVYRPTLLNRQPVEVIAPIDVIFTLTQ